MHRKWQKLYREVPIPFILFSRWWRAARDIALYRIQHIHMGAVDRAYSDLNHFYMCLYKISEIWEPLICSPSQKFYFKNVIYMKFYSLYLLGLAFSLIIFPLRSIQTATWINS